MASPNIAVTFEIEPIVKLYCRAFNCRFNAFHNPPDMKSATCTLKILTIGNTGGCLSFERYEKVVSNDDA